MTEAFAQQCLKEHNRMRALHGCPPLTLDLNLSKGAQEHSDYLLRKQRLEHAHGNFGENISYTMHSHGVSVTGEQQTQRWYCEIKDHNFDGEFNTATGHFTQVIWKSTRKCGFGITYSPDKTKLYVVARYSPPGNVCRQFAANVPKLQRKPLFKLNWTPH